MNTGDRAAAWRGTLTRLIALLSAHPSPWLLLAAASPFVPGACQFVHRGIPDVLFTGDGGTLELRVLHAARGTQLLGPYSRFHWSHPGPAFFYLALPLYELFHERGPALNLFAFIANLACVLALTLEARRLRGAVFALGVAVLLAVYECADPQFQLSGEWNPVTPILPLALLTFLCAHIALGNIAALTPFAFIASAIVQTHIGFVPVASSLCALALAFGLGRKFVRRAALFRHEASAPPTSLGRVFAATAGVLVIVWLPPIVESATQASGNLGALYRFFTSAHPAEHSWRTVVETAAPKVAFLPLVLGRLMGFSQAPSSRLALGVASAEVAALGAMLADAWRRRDDFLIVLSSIALSEIAASLVAVRAIRGDIYPHLVLWITIVGWVGAVAIVAWGLSVAAHTLKRPAVAVGLTLCALAGLAVCLREQAHRVDVFRSSDADVERLAHDVRQYLATEHVDAPLIRIATGDQWPAAVGVVLYLFKHRVPIFVDRYWLFMMGTEFAAPSPEEHPWIHIGDRAFYESVRTRPDFQLVASAGSAFSFLSNPHYLRDHRLPGAPVLLSTTGVVGDPARAVDGVIPAEGTQWDSPLSVVLTSTTSAIEVAVPRGDVNGVFLSVDGSDNYAVHCNREGGETVPLGSALAGVPIGMGTALLFSDELSSCRSVTLKPERGDGYYSVGEIGFLERK